MVAIGILAIVSIGALQLFSFMFANQKNNYQMSELLSLQNEIRTFLSETANCRASLNGIKPTDNSGWPTLPRQLNILGGSANPFLKVGATYAEGLTLTNMQFVNLDRFDPFPAGALYYKGIATLQLTFNKTINNLGPTTLLRRIKLAVTLKNASFTPMDDQIITCNDVSGGGPITLATAIKQECNTISAPGISASCPAGTYMLHASYDCGQSSSADPSIHAKWAYRGTGVNQNTFYMDCADGGSGTSTSIIRLTCCAL